MSQSALKSMDVAWMEIPALAAHAPVSAAKLHVLQLGPIKERLGPRWPRLSELVHKLFEKALRRAQGPRDHFVLVEELSYVATFHGLSPHEAGLACAAVAREVCEMLFGQDTEYVSVRSLIGSVPGSMMELTAQGAVTMSAALEKTGKETIIVRTRPTAADPGWLIRAHRLAASVKHAIGFYPAWELARRKSQMLFLGIPTRHRGPAGVLRALASCEMVPHMEIALLHAAAAFGAKIEHSGQICAIHAGVSSDTLCCVHSRAAYLQAIRSVNLSPNCPLFIKIEQIPPGMPLGRVRELVAHLAVPGIRLLLEFDQIRAIPPLNFRLGVAGIGAVLPEHCPPSEARLLVELLRSRAREQHVCAFLHGLDTQPLVELAAQAGLKFGMGMGFGPFRGFSGLEEVPSLPLSLD